MKKSELKRLIKECIDELELDEGISSWFKKSSQKKSQDSNNGKMPANGPFKFSFLLDDNDSDDFKSTFNKYVDGIDKGVDSITRIVYGEVPTRNELTRMLKHPSMQGVGRAGAYKWVGDTMFSVSPFVGGTSDLSKMMKKLGVNGE